MQQLYLEISHVQWRKALALSGLRPKAENQLKTLAYRTARKPDNWRLPLSIPESFQKLSLDSTLVTGRVASGTFLSFFRTAPPGPACFSGGPS
jgi:hypothetical protein